MDLVAVDIETTGLRGDRDLITEVAVVRFTEYGTIIGEWSTLVRAVPLDQHGLPVDPLTRIHGIPASALVRAPRWAHIAHRVAHALDGATIVGHNARRFDIPFIQQACARVGRSFSPAQIIDTLEWDRRYRQTSGKHRLVDACAAWGIPLNPHRALADTKATAALAIRQAAVVGWAA